MKWIAGNSNIIRKEIVNIILEFKNAIWLKHSSVFLDKDTTTSYKSTNKTHFYMFICQNLKFYTGLLLSKTRWYYFKNFCRINSGTVILIPRHPIKLTYLLILLVLYNGIANEIETLWRQTDATGPLSRNSITYQKYYVISLFFSLIQ